MATYSKPVKSSIQTSPYSEDQARKNITSFYDDLEMPGGYTWNHSETLRMIDLYYSSQYKTGKFDALGLRKFFYNITKPACDIATKFIDLDTKDIILLPEHQDDEFRVWVMQRKLAEYLDDSDFGTLLNDIAFNLPKYGTVVIKKDADNEWHLVSIENLRMTTTVKKLSDSSFVYELISMSKGQIKKMKNWQSAELFARGEEQTYLVYECYDQNDSGWHRTIRGDLYSKLEKSGSINRSVESEINDTSGSYYGGVILYEDDVDNLPYREVHFEKISGRWLGYGFVEYLEENQIALNEAENLERKALIFNGLKLWQTRDETVGGSNVLSAAKNGDILKVESEVTPVLMSSGSELSAFNNTRNNWDRNTERKTFTTDITTGANLPSRTPLGVANLQASLATSYFELKREYFGLFIKKLVIEDIIPDFEKDTDKEHILTFFASDPEIERLNDLMVKRHLDDAVLDYAMKTGFFPSEEERNRVKNEIRNQLSKYKNRFLEVTKGWYRNAKYIVKVNVTGESIDSGAKQQVIQLALQILNTNPQVLLNPVTRRIFFSILSMGGVNPIELGLLDMNELNQAQEQQEAPQTPPELEAARGKVKFDQAVNQLRPGGSVSPIPRQGGASSSTQSY